MSESKPRLVYFNLRGRGEPIRLFLRDNAVDYDDTYPEKWSELKAGLYDSGMAGMLRSLLAAGCANARKRRRARVSA
ncbi:MAG: hypothetical protein P4L40_05085 [Terracidiphilus sp.]|nr:hypothetical protein [Terracidiphilus sp.]